MVKFNYPIAMLSKSRLEQRFLLRCQVFETQRKKREKSNMEVVDIVVLEVANEDVGRAERQVDEVSG